jgi:hypothetical protein
LIPVIEKLMFVTGCRQAKILIDNPQGSENSCSSGSITSIPAWDFFINPDHYEVSTDMKVDSSVAVEVPKVEEAPKKTSMPSHLL